MILTLWHYHFTTSFFNREREKKSVIYNKCLDGMQKFELISSLTNTQKSVNYKYRMTHCDKTSDTPCSTDYLLSGSRYISKIVTKRSAIILFRILCKLRDNIQKRQGSSTSKRDQITKIVRCSLGCSLSHKVFISDLLQQLLMYQHKCSR